MTPTPLPATDPIFGKLSLAALPLHEPILIVTFIVVLALTRIVGVMETRQALDDAARDEATLIAATLSARFADPAADVQKTGWAAALKSALGETLPPP